MIATDVSVTSTELTHDDVPYLSGELPFLNLSAENVCSNLAFPCPADVDDGTGTGTPDGGVTVDDSIHYLGLYESGSLCADLDDGSGTGAPDGGVTIDDLIYFLARFEAGC